MSSSVASGMTGITSSAAGSAGALEIDPGTELQFNLGTSDTNPKVTMTLKHPGGGITDSLAFKVKTTQPRRYLVRPNQGLIAPGGVETVQILLVEKDKKALLQSYQRLGQTALDHAKDKFLVQSCQVTTEFSQEYASAGEEGYDKLSSMWAVVTTNTSAGGAKAPNSSPVANKKLHVRHVVSEGAVDASGAAISTNKGGAPGTTSNLPLETMTSDQLTAELTNLRRKYDELVAFSVNLTAERDILNNTLEQTKRDLNREMNKKNSAAGGGSATAVAPRSGGKNASSSSGGRGTSPVLLLLTALVFFALGVRMQARDKLPFLIDIPVIGPHLAPEGAVPTGGSLYHSFLSTSTSSFSSNSQQPSGGGLDNSNKAKEEL